MKLRYSLRIRPHHAATTSSPPRASVWERSRSAVPAELLASGLAFVLVVAAEFSRAIAAARRYDQLKKRSAPTQRTAANIARRIYMEFYSDG
jgi:hypothetical protein